MLADVSIREGVKAATNLFQFIFPIETPEVVRWQPPSLEVARA